jgi:hypothetical protein
MANLIVTIKEDLTLNNKQQGGIYQNTISGIADIYKRLVTVPSGSDTTLASFKSTVGTADSAMDVGYVKYIRISNIDPDNSVNLSLQIDSGSDDTSADISTTLLLEGGKSFMMGSTTSSAHTDDDSADLITSLSNLESIEADSGANNVQLEVFIASSASGSNG